MNDATTALDAVGIADILKALPHRYPFLMVDRITQHPRRRIRHRHQERHRQRAAIPWATFPNNPVFPGVLMIEGMAQTAGVICIRAIGRRQTAKLVYFMTIDKAKFRKPVVPGDTIEYHVTKIVRRRNIWWYRAEAKVAGQTRGRGRIGAMIADARRRNDAHRPDGADRARRTDRRQRRRSVRIASSAPNVVDRRRLQADGARSCLRSYDDRSAHAHRAVRLPRRAAAIGEVSRRADQGRRSAPIATSARTSPMNIGTEDDRGVTDVGDRCFLMAGTHVAHDCKVGNGVTFANNVLLGGHTIVGDNVVFGGGVAVRQFVRIGEGAMIVGLSGVRADVIPYALAHGPLAHLVGLNVVGLRRRGVARARTASRSGRPIRRYFSATARLRERVDARRRQTYAGSARRRRFSISSAPRRGR